MRTLHADLLSAQTSGYPVSGAMQPAIRCIFTSRSGATTYDYSFNPTINTNRLIYVEQQEHIVQGDKAVILISNYDHSLPTDITGYWVDLGWGMNTASGVRYAESDGAVSPRLWIMSQSYISGAPKGQRPQLLTKFVMGGALEVFEQQPVRLGISPYYRHDGLDNIITEITNKTIYEVLEYFIETTLTLQTGFTFTLDALGTQDDGLISSIRPFVDDPDLTLQLNMETPRIFDNYGQLIKDLLAMTKCYLRPKASLGFKIVYPQSADAVDETYYSSFASGHPFYEMESNKLTMIPNHVEVYGDEDPKTGEPIVKGTWYDTDHYSTWPGNSSPAYDGPYMPVRYTIWDTGITTEGEANDRAASEGRKIKSMLLGARLIIPMDARVEVNDRVEISDAR